MTKRLYVCHANADIESTSEVVDILESALDFPTGALLTSSLPGYSSDARNEDELRSMYGETHVVLALLTQTSALDPEFNFELGAAWALGLRIIAVVLDERSIAALPWPLRSVPAVSLQAPDEWSQLIGDLALRLGLSPRPIPPEALEAFENSALETSALDPITVTDPITETALDPAAAAAIDEAVAALDQAAALIDEVLAPHQAPAADSFRPAASVPPPASAVYTRLPTCEMALEAGRAASDCLYNRSEVNDFVGELDQPLGRFIDALGGSWTDLRRAREFDDWLLVTEGLLGNVPAEARRIEDWYKLGFELATLHNLAVQLELDGPGRSDAGEQAWRNALERFLSRAERAQIGYEELGRVLPLLENLAGPRATRDLANVGRSLSELRRYAAGADGINTAA
jgi:hypothetical protein